MSVKQRKLYPAPTNDQNISCPDFCVDSTPCPYGCDAYVDVYPLPPPPSPPKPASSSSGGQPISTLLIIIITVLAGCFLLVSYYVVIVKYCKRRNPFWARRRQSPRTLNEEFLDENRGPEIDHPIWYINTIGLQPSIINAITVFRYKRGDNLIEGTECAVCLNEFQNDETLRLLPKCNHAFHIPCIDTWLRSHTNCPVCRAGIVSNSAANPLTSNGVNSIIIPMNESSDGDSSETGESNNSDEATDELLCENRSDTNGVTEFVGVGSDNHEATDISKTNADSKGNNDNMIGDEKHEIQAVRRSVSVDSFMAADISRAVNGLSTAECEEVLADPSHKVEPQQGSGEDVGGNSGGQRTNGGSSIADFLRKKPVRMKRSFSYAGRSFLQRQQYPRSNSILPL